MKFRRPNSLKNTTNSHETRLLLSPVHVLYQHSIRVKISHEATGFMAGFVAGFMTESGLDFVVFVAAENQFFLAESYGNYHKSATEMGKKNSRQRDFCTHKIC